MSDKTPRPPKQRFRYQAYNVSAGHYIDGLYATIGPAKAAITWDRKWRNNPKYGPAVMNKYVVKLFELTYVGEEPY